MVEILKELSVSGTEQSVVSDINPGGNTVTPEPTFTIDQTAFASFQTNTAPVLAFVGTKSPSSEDLITEGGVSFSVPPNNLQDTNTTFSEDVPVFIENLSVEMAKRGGRPHNPVKKSQEQKIKEIKRNNNIPPGTRVEKHYVLGKGEVPCKWVNGKWVPIR